MQPVSVSPPSDFARRQNGLADSCHRKRVSLTRNLDEESSKAIRNRIRAKKSLRNQVARKRDGVLVKKTWLVIFNILIKSIILA